MSSAELHRLSSCFDRVAIAQLRAEVARLGAENDQLRAELSTMQDCAEAWRHDALTFQMELCHQSGGSPGITESGDLVVVTEGASS